MTIPSLVSVIIPTYNRAHLIARAIRSVLAQNHPEMEVLIIDDCSNDGTERVVDEMNDSRVRYIRHSENRGGSAARNTGLRAAQGDYIAFLDSDDIWKRNKLKRQLDILRITGEDAGAVYAGFLVIDGKGRVLSTFEPRHRGELLSPLLRRNCIGTTSTVLVRRKCFETVGLFDEGLRSCQDWDMWIRLAKYFRFEYVPEMLVMYTACGSSNRISSDVSAILDGHNALFSKHAANMAQLTDTERADLLLYLGKTVILAGAPAQGRLLLRDAISLDPACISAYIYALSTVAGPRVFDALRSLYRRMRRTSKGIHFDPDSFAAGA